MGFISTSQIKTFHCVSQRLDKATSLILCGSIRRISVLHTHLYSSQVWLPKYTLTLLPAPRFSPTMVTFVPPDSGPLPGARASIEGVCGEPKVIELSLHTGVGQKQNTVCFINCLVLHSPVLLALAEYTSSLLLLCQHRWCLDCSNRSKLKKSSPDLTWAELDCVFQFEITFRSVFQLKGED